MTGPNELERMARANPWPAAAGDARSPAARGLVEDTMTTTETGTPRRRAKVLMVGAAATVLVGGLVVGASVVSGGDGDGEPRAAQPVEAGPGTGLCAEVYDLTTLVNRDFAFAGTVEAVDGDAVTFTVDEWFRGDRDETVTLQGALGLSGLTSAGAGVDLAPGSRLLVSGDDQFVWSCGFTMPYDEAVAQQWADKLTR